MKTKFSALRLYQCSLKRIPRMFPCNFTTHMCRHRKTENRLSFAKTGPKSADGSSRNGPKPNNKRCINLHFTGSTRLLPVRVGSPFPPGATLHTKPRKVPFSGDFSNRFSNTDGFSSDGGFLCLSASPPCGKTQLHSTVSCCAPLSLAHSRCLTLASPFKRAPHTETTRLQSVVFSRVMIKVS